MTKLTEAVLLEKRNDEKLEIAKNALREGAGIEFIKKITGLDEFVIRDLQAKIAR